MTTGIILIGIIIMLFCGPKGMRAQRWVQPKVVPQDVIIVVASPPVIISVLFVNTIIYNYNQ